MKFLHLVWRNLMRKKLRTALTILSVLVAFVLYGFLGAVKQALVGGVDLAGADRIVVRHKTSIILNLPQAYEARIERIPGVAKAVAFTWFNGIYQDPKNFFGSYPTDPETCLEVYPEIVIPQDQKQAWFSTRTGAMVGRGTADRFGWKIGDHIPLISPIWPKADGSPWEFDIVAIYDAGKKGFDTTGFYFHYDYFDEARQWGEGEIGWYIVQVDDPDHTVEIAQAIDQEFANSPAETKAEPEGAFMQGFAQQIGDIGTIMLAILGAVFFTILLVAGNTMAQSVRERTEELGVLKAMGFSNGLVLAVVLGESLFIALLGGLIGLGLSTVMVGGFATALAAFLPNFVLPTGHLIAGFFLVVGLGLVAGFLPALQAGRLRIADALRRGT